ncbi:MAG: HIT domain-containing protein [Myxococcota bacterium]|jgi:ATP adenylyltransferase
MERLFAPWRMEYIRSGGSGPEGCIFCDKPMEAGRRDNLLLYADDLTLVMLNRFPYSNGHLLVVPRTHTASLAALGPAEFEALFRAVSRCVEILKAAFRPDGFNVGINLGRVAGAGIDQHLHVHVVPRWNGDTNFMPVLGETKVISEHLLATYDDLLPRFGH